MNLMNVTKLDLEQGSEEWLSWRKDSVGGSDIGAIMCLNPFKNRRLLYLERTGQKKQPNLENNPDIQ